MNQEMKNQELLQELEKRVKQGEIILDWSVVGCYNCDAEGAIGLAIKGFRVDFSELAEVVETIKKEQEEKELATKSELLKDFSEADLQTEIYRREKNKTN